MGGRENPFHNSYSKHKDKRGFPLPHLLCIYFIPQVPLPPLVPCSSFIPQVPLSLLSTLTTLYKSTAHITKLYYEQACLLSSGLPALTHHQVCEHVQQPREDKKTVIRVSLVRLLLLARNYLRGVSMFNNKKKARALDLSNVDPDR